jgi:membrane protease YdiL (CAAX protease family)
MPATAIAALLLARPGTSVWSAYAFDWYAVVLLLVAVAGRGRAWAASVAAVLGALGGLVIATESANALLRGTDLASWTYLVGSVFVIGISLVQLAGGLGRLRPLDPVVLATVQIGVGLFVRWLYYLVSGLGLDYRTYTVDTLASPFRVELPILALALAAAGLGLSRTWRPALTRLGLTKPAWWQLCLALLLAMCLALSTHYLNQLTLRFTPRTYYSIYLIDYYRGSPMSIQLLFAVMAGICEETLFRGALQPRAGILLTALLFAMIHIQYGLSPILGGVFVHGVIYGLLRRHINTSTAIFAHGAYDLVPALGIGRGGFAIIAVVMVAALIVPAMRNRRSFSDLLRATTGNDWFPPGLATGIRSSGR